MLVTEARPRNLSWTHAGPLLYGDWGTSRLYVLGLAFLYTAHASIVYLAMIGLLMLAVSWAYTVICRCFPDGGGVYTAARQLSPTLSVVGSTLLLSGYIMTAAISVVEACHYFGLPETFTLPVSVVTLLLLGGINYLGAKSAGRFALVIAIAALIVSAVMAVLAVPFFVRGVQSISFHYFREVAPSDAWVNFTKLCLALAGVEAVANMTGLMKEPVDGTAKKTIWPVAGEVVGLNLVFGLALTGLLFVVGGVAMANMTTPDDIRLAERRAEFVEMLPPEVATEAGPAFTERFGELTDEQIARLPEQTQLAYHDLHEHEEKVEQYTNASMKVTARETATHWFGPELGFIFSKIAGITFGLLLLSATNTAIMATVSVLFAMAQDNELPRPLAKLNYSGVPWVGLIVAVVIPLAVVAVERDVTVLAKLYVLGVCGAITVSLLSCVFNRELEISKPTRVGMMVIGLFLLAVTVTIGVTQLESTAFSGALVAIVLTTRALLARGRKAQPEALPEPVQGWLAEVNAREVIVDPDKPKIMLAARGRYQAEFAVDLARQRGATLMVMFVRTLRVLDIKPGSMPRIETDPDAQEALGSVVVLARDAGVPCIPIYMVSSDLVGEILDHTVTYGCDTLIMGKSRRSRFSRRLEGDVVTQVKDVLPNEVSLITRSAELPHVPKAGTGITAD